MQHPRSVSPPPGLPAPGLLLPLAFEDSAKVECVGIQFEPAYVVAESVDSSPPSPEGFAVHEIASPVAKVFSRNLLGSASGVEPFDTFDSVVKIGDAFKAAAAFEPSGPPPAQQDVWSIYRDLINSQTPQVQEAKPEPGQFEQQWPPRRTRQRRRMCQVLIATQLNALQDEDPSKVLMLRKINRLGFDSSAILRAHYERFGPVSKVLVSNNHDKQTGEKHRVRPSGIGFVLFEEAEDAEQALAAGAWQVVGGHEVFVRPFESRGSRSSRSGSSEFPDGNSECGDQEVEDAEASSMS